MNKIVSSVEAAIAGVTDGASIMMGGFGSGGVPENLIRGLLQKGVRDLTVISNNPGLKDFGIGLLLKAGQVRKMVLSYAGANKHLGQLMLSGELEVEFVPQGTLAERIRAGGRRYRWLLYADRLRYVHRRRQGSPRIRQQKIRPRIAVESRFCVHQGLARRRLGKPGVSKDGPELQSRHGNRGNDDDCRSRKDRPARRTRPGLHPYAGYLRPDPVSGRAL